jgi:hypothetical protein
MKRRDKAIVILAIVTISAFSGLAVLGFYYRQVACFGPCGHGESLSINSAVCTGLECTFTVLNSGTMNVNVVGCRIQIGNTTVNGVIQGDTALNAGTSAQFACGIQGTEPSTGSEDYVTILLDNGDTRGFSVIWS